MRSFPLSPLALALLTLMSTAQAQQSSELGKISVTGEGDKLGTGLLIDEDTPKAKSTVTKAQMEKTRSSSNPFQALSMLPGVNSSSQDATGLFGGNLRVRGFNSDQMGFTVDGAPVNDSGNFAVYPQEYADMENMCEMFITQGATDTEAPHVGASGGNVGLVTCAPEDQRRTRIALSGGGLDYARTFVRVDTGKVGDFKGFASLSKSQVEKWRGKGGADRVHVDAKAEYDLGAGSSLSATVLYNKAVNNSFRLLRLSDLASEGYFADFPITPPTGQRAPVAGTAQVESGSLYYGLALNPFENYLATSRASFQIDPRLRVDVEPYFWWGFGNGGSALVALPENAPAGTRLHQGVADLNGDGDTLDTILVYRASVTRTHRPGVTLKANYTLDNHKIVGGVWFERARHRQTAPAVRVDDAGQAADIWLEDESAFVRYNDGSPYQNRNQYTVTTARSVFIQDTVDLLDSKLRLIPALNYRDIQRDFQNFANSATTGSGVTASNSSADYQVQVKFGAWLPSLSASYQFTDKLQGFAGLSRNFKAPGNFEYQNLIRSTPAVVFSNGTATSFTMLSRTLPKEETSINLDIGTRYRDDRFKGSVTAFFVSFKNRIASGWDSVAQARTSINVGDSTIKGLEIEAGTVPYRGFSAYVSGTYTRSKIIDDLQVAVDSVGNPTPAATAGTQFPDTPKGMAALALQYSNGPYMVNLSGKYTGPRNLTLVNDVAIPGYTSMDLNAAWQLPNPTESAFKNPIVRLNITNLTNKKFLSANAGSGTLIAIDQADRPQAIQGAPRFTSLTFQVDY